jgi:hypothetical protein
MVGEPLNTAAGRAKGDVRDARTEEMSLAGPDATWKLERRKWLHRQRVTHRVQLLGPLQY